MSKRNLQIEIPETEYSGDEKGTFVEENQNDEGNNQENSYYEKPIAHHEIQVPVEGDEVPNEENGLPEREQ